MLCLWRKQTRDTATQTDISSVNSYTHPLGGGRRLIEQTGNNKNEVAGTIQRDKKCIKGSEESRLGDGEFGHIPKIQSRSVHGHSEFR